MKNIINTGNKGNINQTPFCISQVTVKLKLPLNNTTAKTAELNISS